MMQPTTSIATRSVACSASCSSRRRRARRRKARRSARSSTSAGCSAAPGRRAPPPRRRAVRRSRSPRAGTPASRTASAARRRSSERPSSRATPGTPAGTPCGSAARRSPPTSSSAGRRRRPTGRTWRCRPGLRVREVRRRARRRSASVFTRARRLRLLAVPAVGLIAAPRGRDRGEREQDHRDELGPVAPLRVVHDGRPVSSHGSIHLHVHARERLVEDSKRPLHRYRLEAADTIVIRVVEEVEQQEHRRHHGDDRAHQHGLGTCARSPLSAKKSM